MSGVLKARLSLFAPDALLHVGGIEQAVCRYDISTSARLAMFLAQCAHESGGFRTTVENMNYSASRLRAVFPKYFTEAQAKSYAYDGERIASRVYGGRLGNGGEATGDGWRFRGRGLIQLTGRTNYEAFSREYFGDDTLLSYAELLARNPLAGLSAGWYWWSRKLNRFADAGDIDGCTRAINGGLNGIEDRRRWWNKAKQIFR